MASPAKATLSASVLRQGFAGWIFTRHAIERMMEMGVDPHEVIETLVSPQLDYPSARYTGCRLCCRNRLLVAYDPSRSTVITVLWNGKEGRNG